MAPRTERLLKSIFVSIGAFGAIVFCVNLAQSVSRKPVAATQQQPVMIYNAQRICEEVFNQHLDFTDLKDNHFTVTLPEGCFSGWVRVPRFWKDWHSDPTGDQTGYWVAYWYENDYKPLGPFYANDNRNLNKSMQDAFRLQGHGVILFYSNTVAPLKATPAETTDEKQEVPITTVDARGNYVQEKFCNDSESADGQLHYENLHIDHFTVKMQERCWSPYIFVPNWWQGFYAQSVGTEPDWWVADWQQNRTPRGPFTRNDSNTSPYWKEWYSHVFRLQGKGTIYFSQNPEH
jgi:hypothetical protein